MRKMQAICLKEAIILEVWQFQILIANKNSTKLEKQSCRVMGELFYIYYIDLFMKVYLFIVIMRLWLLIMIIYFTKEFVLSSLFYYQ